MKKLPIKYCWECKHYDEENPNKEGNYQGKCRHPEIDGELITEFLNGSDIASWCPLEEY